MKILLASSEVHPYSKTGGLADMVGALAKALARDGHRIGLVTPLYRGIRERHPAITKLDWTINLPLGTRYVQADVWTLELEAQQTIYFIDQPEFYQRGSLYQENGADFPDNAARFIFFAKCVAQLARYLPWQPELVHVHDWQAALVPALIRYQAEREGWGNPPGTCLTIHNLAYQGVFPRADYALTNLPEDWFTPAAVEFHQHLNCLKTGIVFADQLTTVSPRYAREITTEAYGCGLDGVLRGRAAALTGILNGVDYDEWKTTGNPCLLHAYTQRNLRGKLQDKLALQQELGLPVDPSIPLFGNITRLADQKGIDIQLGALEEMLAANMQLILLGSGAPVYEKACLTLARRHPARAAIRIGYDHALSHRIEAGCDFYLMPSRFEPCGLNQMYSLRYGTIPIVRATGGLDDSVIDLQQDSERANGIKFFEYSVRALSQAIRKALALYQDAALLRHFRQNAMAADFSWERTTRDYEQVFALATQKP